MMSLDIKDIFEEDMTEQEMIELLQYSADDTTLAERYIVACQIISNLTKDIPEDITESCPLITSPGSSNSFHIF